MLVYFVRPIGRRGPIKIGCTAQTRIRLAALMRWSPIPLEIVATAEGSYADEQRIHKTFAAQRSHLEWFHPSPELETLIDRVAQGESIEAVIGPASAKANRRRGRPESWRTAALKAAQQQSAA